MRTQLLPSTASYHSIRLLCTLAYELADSAATNILIDKTSVVHYNTRHNKS
jgi:hypothetical protein